MIIKEIDQVSEIDFVNFLDSVSDDFNPVLNVKINFKEYYEKLKSVGHILVCYDENEICGLVVYYSNLEIAQITLVAVHKKYRHRGVASFLINNVCSYINKPIKIITWENNHKAISLYKKYGFVEKKRQINEYDVTELIMVRE